MQLKALSSFAIATLATLLISDISQAQPQRDDYRLYQTDYHWLEIEDIGEELGDFRNNDVKGPFEIGYEFPFLGEIYEEFWISSNGFIGFGPSLNFMSSENQNFPDESLPNNIIALFWKDLNPAAFWADGMVFTAVRDNHRVIEFQGIGEHNPDGVAPENTITMQVVLKADGDIIIQYQEIGEDFDLEVGTIGIEGPEGIEGLTVRFDNEGEEVANETAFLISDHGPGDFLVWDAGVSPSGQAQVEALEALGHTVVYRDSDDDLPAVDVLEQYEGIFVNLGNHGPNGRDYHVLSEAEGRIIAEYLESGNAVYLEGSDTFHRDDATDAHPFFHIEGLADGGSLSPPVVGFEDTFGEGFTFDEYDADNNSFVDHIAPVDGSLAIFSFFDDEEEFIGMVGLLSDVYRTIGCSFEFGGLVDGDGGNKQDLMERMVEFFRVASPDFPPPLNLSAVVGDGEITISWDHPRRAERAMNREIIDLQHEIAGLMPRDGEKPDVEARELIVEMRIELARLIVLADNLPQRDELQGFTIYVNGEEYDFTNAHEYAIFDLENGQEYEFSVTAVYEDPAGESDPAGPIIAVPTESISPEYNQNFEEFNGALTPTPGENAWQWGEPGIGAHGDARAWGTLLDRNYASNAQYYLQLPTIDLSDVQQCYLSWFQFMDAENVWDGGQVQVSLDGGDRWELLTPIDGYPFDQIFSLNSTPGFTGTDEDWHLVEFDLTEWEGEQVLVRLLFGSDESIERNGWFIDDLSLFVPQLGSLEVTVSDGDNDLEGALVILLLAEDVYDSRYTDGDGEALFENVPAGEYTLRVTLRNFVDHESQVEVIANEDESERVILGGWNSVLDLAPGEIAVEMDFDSVQEESFTITNIGGDDTNFEIYINYFNVEDGQHAGYGDIPDNRPEPNPWNLIQTINLTELTGDRYIYGAEFVRHYDDDDVEDGPYNYRFIVGAGNFEGENCHFYLFNRDLELDESVLQAGGRYDGWGLRDLTYDPIDHEIFGSTDDVIHRIDPMSGNRFNTIEGADLDLNRAMAYVPEDNAFWVGNWDDTWFKIERGSGRVLDQNSQHGLAGVTGMAWNPSDDDGHSLYIHNQESENGGAAIYRYDPETRDLERILVTAEEDEGFAGGIFVTYLYDTHKFHLGAVIQGEDGDVLKLYELWDRKSWIYVDTFNGDIASGEEQTVAVTIDSRLIYEEELTALIDVVDIVSGDVPSVECLVNVIGGRGSISGTVTLEVGDDDVNIGNATVILQDGFGVPIGFGRAPDLVDDDWVFNFDRLNPGDYIVEVDLFGYELWVSDVIVLEPEAEEVLEISLILSPVGAIDGTIISIYNSAIDTAEITIFDPENGEQINRDPILSDEEGYYIIEGLEPGLYNILVQHDNFGSVRENGVEVVDQETTEVNFELNDRRRVRSLRTNGYHDDGVELIWAAPGISGEEVELAHHSGVLANGVYLINPNDQLAVKFFPEGDYDIVNVNIYIIRRFGPLGGDDGWPDRSAHELRLWIYAEDPETGMPGEELKEITLETRNRNGGQFGWESVVISDVRFNEGPFYVAWSQDDPERNFGDDAVALDDENNNEGTTFARFDNEWREYNDFPGDMLIDAVIWSYFEDEDDGELMNVRPRRVRSVGASPNNDFDASSIALMDPAFAPLSSPKPRVDWRAIFDLKAPPLRDDVNNYRIFFDGEALEGVVLADSVRSWFHETGSDHEDEEHTYSIGTMFTDPREDQELEDEEILGVERVGDFNMSPGNVFNIAVEMDGQNFTISWTNPSWNEDGSNCVDYEGTAISLNGAFAAYVEGDAGDNNSWTGELDAGEEGWYDVSLVSRDEVPNWSITATATLPIGQAIVNGFETNALVFNRDPVGGWARRSPRNGEPHGGNYNWETNRFGDNYDNDVVWNITTAFEYNVVSEAASLEFFHYLETELGRDGGQVLISVDGEEWSLLTPEGGYPDQTVEAFRNAPAYTGNMADWTLAQFDLSDYQGSVIKIKFRFASDESLNNYDGWHIDDMVFWGCEFPDYATITGVVTDQHGDPVSDIVVSDGRQDEVTDEAGEFSLQNVLAGEIVVTAQASGYNYIERALEIEVGEDINLDINIVRATVVADQEAFEFELGGNDHVSVEIEVTNETEIDLPYWIRITSTPEHLRDQQGVRNVRSTGGGNLDRDDRWDVAFDINLTENIEHSRIMGAEFAMGNFYITSADPARGAMVHVLDWRGNLINSFDQPIDVVGWGLRDLAFDGELLYGSQGNIIYGFTTEGELADEIQGAPITVNRALAYDPIDDGFWVGEWDSPWYFVDREGQAELIWEGHGLEGVYGFAYHQDDIDRMPLYVLNLNDEGNTDIYRADPLEEELELVHQVENAPTGCFITGSWDDDRWILGAVTGIATQHLVGLELGSRVSWLTVTPSNGEIGAGGSEVFSIDVQVPIDANEDDLYEGEISFRVFNEGILSIPVEARITDGFQHFDSPEVTDIIHTIEIESALYQGNSLPIGSEIAVVTPRGEIGGVMRWLDHADEFPAYQGDGAFNEDEPLEFRVWISNIDRVYEPSMQILGGFGRFLDGETTTYALSIVIPDTQTVELVRGWNLSSIYIQPEFIGVEEILGGINDRGNIVIVKNGIGGFWWPELDYHGLDEWDMLEGYQINVAEDESFTVLGARVDPATQIDLDRGWNSISYLLDHQVDSRIALSGILDDIRIAKDGSGRFMVPDVNFYGLGPMVPGRGYKLKMHRNAELIYNDQDGDGEIQNVMKIIRLSSTGSDMSVLIEDINGFDRDGITIINAYSANSNILVGSIEVKALPAGIVIHGDDITTEIVDGAMSGEHIRLELLVSSISYQTELKLIEGQLVYSEDEFIRLDINVISRQLPEIFTISNIYPNPFNDMAVIRFSVPEEMNISLIVRDISGREVYGNKMSKYNAGWHDVSINSSEWSSGIYLLDVVADNRIFHRKMVLLK